MFGAGLPVDLVQRRVVDGRAEARRQKLGFLVGSIRAAVEGRSWEEAERLLGDLREMEVSHPEIGSFIKVIQAGRVSDRIAGLLEQAEEALKEEQWVALGDYAAKLEAIAPGHKQLTRFKTATEQGHKVTTMVSGTTAVAAAPAACSPPCSHAWPA